MEKAFEARWGVSVTRQAGAVRMPVDTFRRVHAQLLLLPRDQVEGTWTKLVHANNSRGAYMSHDGEFGLGEDAAAVESGTYGGAALSLMEDAAAGATELHLAATSLVGPGIQLTVGEGEAAETVTIKAVNGDRTVFTVDPPLTRDHAFGEAVAQTNNRERTVQWLEAAVRHEMGHAVDNRMGSVTGLTEDLGGWHSTTDFDTWAALMGDPWATSDGTEITADERQQIKARIERLKTTPTTAGLGDGLAADHAIMKFWNLGVPVIEAARPMAQHGSKYWKNSGDYYGTNGHFFTINDYYGEFHAFSPEVQYNQVRGYATYSPAEFFAELYTVYYEEAGTEGADLGRLIPVASWRTWMTENVHNAHHGPEQEGE